MSDLVKDLRSTFSSASPDSYAMCVEAAARIEALEAALRAVIDDIHKYERINKLSSSPGKSECWQTVAHAMALLAPALTLSVTPVYATDLEAKMDAEIRRLRARIEALEVAITIMGQDSDAELARLTEALRFIADGYDNHDINHVDYRVKVYQVALDALAGSQDK